MIAAYFFFSSSAARFEQSRPSKSVLIMVSRERFFDLSVSPSASFQRSYAIFSISSSFAMASFWTSSAPSAPAFWNDAMAFL